MAVDSAWTGGSDIELSADGREVVLRGPPKPPLLVQLSDQNEVRISSPFAAVSKPEQLVSAELRQSLRAALVFAEWVSAGEFGVALRLRHFALFAPPVLDALMNITLLLPNSNGIDGERLKLRARRHLLSVFLCAAVCCAMLSGSLVAMNSVWPVVSVNRLVWMTLALSMLFAIVYFRVRQRSERHASPWLAVIPFSIFLAMLCLNGVLDAGPPNIVEARVIDLEHLQDVDQDVVIVTFDMGPGTPVFTHDVLRVKRVPQLWEVVRMHVMPGALLVPWVSAVPDVETSE